MDIAALVLRARRWPSAPARGAGPGRPPTGLNHRLSIAGDTVEWSRTPDTPWTST